MSELPSNFSELDAGELGNALGAEPRAMRDVAHGDGEALDVGDAVLEVYRDAGFARVTTPDARIELYRVPSYTISGERVVFEQGENDARSRLLVRNDGKVSFYPVLRATESPTTAETAPGGQQQTPLPRRTRSQSPTAGSTETLGSTEPSEDEVVQITGHVGRGPWFYGEGDMRSGSFALGEKVDQGRTKWHNQVSVFGQVSKDLEAAQLKGTMGVGAHVAVTGQHTTGEYQTESGKIRKRREFHVAEFSILRPPRRGPARSQ